MKKKDFEKLKWNLSEPQKREEFEFYKFENEGDSVTCVEPRVRKLPDGRGNKVDNLIVTDDTGNDLCLGSYFSLLDYFRDHNAEGVPFEKNLAFKITYKGEQVLEKKNKDGSERKVKNFAFEWAEIA